MRLNGTSQTMTEAGAWGDEVLVSALQRCNETAYAGEVPVEIKITVHRIPHNDQVLPNRRVFFVATLAEGISTRRNIERRFQILNHREGEQFFWMSTLIVTTEFLEWENGVLRHLERTMKFDCNMRTCQPLLMNI